MLRVREGIDIGELARRLKDSAGVLRRFAAGNELLALDDDDIDKADDRRGEERQLIGAVGAVLVERLEHARVGERPQRIENAVQHRQNDREGGLGVAAVRGLLARGAQLVVLVRFDDAETDDADADEHRRRQLADGQPADAARDERQHRHQRAGGVADRTGDAQLDIA